MTIKSIYGACACIEGFDGIEHVKAENDKHVVKNARRVEIQEQMESSDRY